MNVDKSPHSLSLSATVKPTLGNEALDREQLRPLLPHRVPNTEGTGLDWLRGFAARLRASGPRIRSSARGLPPRSRGADGGLSNDDLP
jgi:hypothetical protein